MLQFDWFGNELAPGDMVVYPRRHKGKLDLGSLTIHEIHADKLVGHNLAGRRTIVRNLDRVAKVQGLSEPRRRRRVQCRGQI